MGNTFSPLKNAYQMDIYFNGKKPYLLCENINTRYAWIHELKSKNTNDVLEVFKKFVEELRPAGIKCDAEAAFSSIKFIDYCQENHIVLRVVLNELHSDLGSINRLCRTLRDMDYSDPVKAVKQYNKRFHESIGMAPREMQFDDNAQLKYLFDQLELRDKKNKLLLDHSLKRGDRVRYVLDEKEHRFQKQQYHHKLSNDYYFIEQVRSPYAFDIIAEDGSTKTVPRFRLFKVKKGDDSSFAKTIEDGSSFTIYDEISDYFPVFKKNGDLDLNKTKYEVRLISRDSEGHKVKNKQLLSIRQLRIGNPTELINMEREFYMRNRDRFKLQPKTNFLIPK